MRRNRQIQTIDFGSVDHPVCQIVKILKQKLGRRFSGEIRRLIAIHYWDKPEWEQAKKHALIVEYKMIMSDIYKLQKKLTEQGEKLLEMGIEPETIE